jgi:hypothetical protein
MDSDSADLTRIRTICSRFPEAEEGELQDRPLFHVRRRRFAIFNGTESPRRRRWESFGRSLHLATSPQLSAQIENDDRFVASPHHGFRGWVALDLEKGAFSWGEIDELLEAAYKHVAGRELVDELERELRG